MALGPDVPDGHARRGRRVALLVQQAQPGEDHLRARAAGQDPKHPRAMLGAAMASLLGRDWETAGKQIWDARDLAPKEQRQALAAAIDDLRGIARVQ